MQRTLPLPLRAPATAGSPCPSTCPRPAAPSGSGPATGLPAGWGWVADKGGVMEAGRRGSLAHRQQALHAMPAAGGAEHSSARPPAARPALQPQATRLPGGPTHPWTQSPRGPSAPPPPGCPSLQSAPPAPAPPPGARAAPAARDADARRGGCASVQLPGPSQPSAAEPKLPRGWERASPHKPRPMGACLLRLLTNTSCGSVRPAMTSSACLCSTPTDCAISLQVRRVGGRAGRQRSCAEAANSASSGAPAAAAAAADLPPPSAAARPARPARPAPPRCPLTGLGGPAPPARGPTPPTTRSRRGAAAGSGTAVPAGGPA